MLIRQRRRRARFRRRVLLFAILLILLPSFGAREVWRYYMARPRGIVLHHSATASYKDGRPIGAADLDKLHAQRGFEAEYDGRIYHIGYHYVIRADGALERGRPVTMHGAHAGDFVHNDYVGICVVGCFLRHPAKEYRGPGWRNRVSEEQMQALTALCLRLCRTYHLRLRDIVLHRDLKPTLCPGAAFPYWELIHRLHEAGVPR